MATKQRIAYGAAVEWGTDGVAYTGIPEAEGLAVPEVQIEYHDVTNFDSAGGFREFIAGLKDAGEITIPCGYTTALYTSAVGYQTNGTLIYFRTELPLETGQSTTGDEFKFTGYVTPRLQTNAVGEPIKMDLVIRTSGNVTFTAGS